jgi:hypothetical protein
MLIISNTDEFVILMLRNKNNYDYILKIIGIYGLYVSVLGSIKNTLLYYATSKTVLIGIDNKKIIKEVRTNSYILGMLFVVFSIFIVPIIINVLFNPSAKTGSYFDTNFSIPICIFFALEIFYTPTSILLKTKNKFKTLAMLSFVEGIINLILSISLIRILGIY